jgi:hypothetical protein
MAPVASDACKSPYLWEVTAARKDFSCLIPLEVLPILLAIIMHVMFPPKFHLLSHFLLVDFGLIPRMLSVSHRGGHKSNPLDIKQFYLKFNPIATSSPCTEDFHPYERTKPLFSHGFDLSGVSKSQRKYELACRAVRELINYS